MFMAHAVISYGDHSSAPSPHRLWSLANISPPISEREFDGTVRPCRPSFSVGVEVAAAAGAVAAVVGDTSAAFVGARMRAMYSGRREAVVN